MNAEAGGFLQTSVIRLFDVTALLDNVQESSSFVWYLMRQLVCIYFIRANQGLYSFGKGGEII